MVKDDKTLKAILDEINTQISARVEQAQNEKNTLHYHQISAEIRGLELARRIVVERRDEAVNPGQVSTALTEEQSVEPTIVDGVLTAITVTNPGPR